MSAFAIFLRFMPAIIQERLRDHADFKKIINNSSWLLLDKFLRLFLGVFLSAWTARYLGPSEFGELAYTIAFIAFFQVIAGLGVDAIVVRDISSGNSRSGEILGTAFVLRLVAGVVSWFVAVGMMIGFYGLGDRSVLLVSLAGLVLVFQAVDTIDLWFQSQSQNKISVIVKGSTYIISSAIKACLILSAASLYAFSAVIALEVAITAVGLYIVFRQSEGREQWVFTKACAWRMISESWPFIVAGLSVITYMRIDQVMIKQMLGSESLGFYSVVQALSSLWHVIPLTICISLAPFVAKKKAEGESAYYEILLKIFRLFIISSVIISIFIHFSSYFLVGLIYGGQYVEAARILSIHIFSVIPVFLGLARGMWIVNERKSMFSLYSAFIGAALSVIMNLVLIPGHGMEGAAIAAVVSYFASAVFLTALFDFRIFLMQLGIRSRSRA